MKADILNHIDEIKSTIMYHLIISKGVERINALVQENHEFFGSPLPGDSCIKAAADTLERLIRDAGLKEEVQCTCHENNSIGDSEPMWCPAHDV